MKKKIQIQEDLMSKFEGSKVSALSTITGGIDAAKTKTDMYTTESSADDADTGDHDTDGL